MKVEEEKCGTLEAEERKIRGFGGKGEENMGI